MTAAKDIQKIKKPASADAGSDQVTRLLDRNKKLMTSLEELINRVDRLEREVSKLIMDDITEL